MGAATKPSLLDNKSLYFVFMRQLQFGALSLVPGRPWTDEHRMQLMIFEYHLHMPACML